MQAWLAVLAGVLWAGTAVPQAAATEIGMIGFQFSSETHARVSNAPAEAARARGRTVTLLNS